MSSPNVPGMCTYVQLPEMKKRKRTVSMDTIERTFGDLSISRLNRYRMTTKNRKRVDPSNGCPILQRINYNLISDDQFIELLKEVDREKHDEIVSFLTKNPCRSLEILRRYTSFVDELVYAELEQNQLNFYYQISSDKGIWMGDALRQRIILDPMTTNDDIQSKIDMENRRQHFENESQRIKRELIAFEEEQLLLLNNHLIPWMNLHELSSMILDFVRHHQQWLREQFNEKREIFVFDVEDYRLLQRMYDLQPTIEQIRHAQDIWQHAKEKLNLETTIDIVECQLARQERQRRRHSLRSVSLLDIKFLLNQAKHKPITVQHWKRCSQMSPSAIHMYFAHARTVLYHLNEKIRKCRIQLFDVTKDDNFLFDVVHEREDHLARRIKSIEYKPMRVYFE